SHSGRQTCLLQILADELGKACASLRSYQSVGARFLGDVNHDRSLSQRFGAGSAESRPDVAVFGESCLPVLFLLTRGGKAPLGLLGLYRRLYGRAFPGTATRSFRAIRPQCGLIGARLVDEPSGRITLQIHVELSRVTAVLNGVPERRLRIVRDRDRASLHN